MTNWNLKSFDNLYASLAESAYRDRPNKFPYEQLDQIQEERSKLKWEYDNEIDAFYTIILFFLSLKILLTDIFYSAGTSSSVVSAAS